MVAEAKKMVGEATTVRNGSRLAARQPVRPPAPVRLTRRGRVLLLGALLSGAAAVAVFLAPPGQAADPPTPAPTTVVQQGDTLWSIAERHAPRRDRFATVDEIRRLNDLDGYGIRTGQKLVLPKVG